MKTLIALALTFAAIASAQTVTVTMTGVSPAVLADINAYWLQQVNPICGTLSAPLDATTTTVTIALSQATLSAAQPVPSVGSAVLLGGTEPGTVSAVSGLNVTVLRGGFPPLNAMVSHQAGETVTPLVFASPWQLLTVPIRQWVIGVVQNLGARSATFGVVATGTVSQ